MKKFLYIITFLLSIFVNIVFFVRIVDTITKAEAQESSCKIEEAMKEIEPGGMAYCFSGREVFRVYKRKDGSLIVYREELRKDTLRKKGKLISETNRSEKITEQ